MLELLKVAMLLQRWRQKGRVVRVFTSVSLAVVGRVLTVLKCIKKPPRGGRPKEKERARKRAPRVATRAPKVAVRQQNPQKMKPKTRSPP